MPPEVPAAILHDVLHTTPVAALLVDGDGRVAQANLRAQELFLLHPMHVGVLRADTLVGDALASSSPAPRQVRRTDGTCFHAEIGTASFLVDGTPHLLATVQGLAHRTGEEAHAQALEMQRLESLAMLAGGVAHDLNNLLVAVLGNAQLAQSLELPGLATECLADIATAAEQASDLSRQLLAYSGRGRFTTQPVDLSVVVEEARTLLRALARTRAEVRIHGAQGLPAILADVGQVRQVLLNLVGNACDAADGACTVHISTQRIRATDDYLEGMQPAGRPAGTYVALKVSDNGSGIEPELLATIFEPMVSTRGPGRGMGLAAVRSIVDGHGGALSVYSEPGRGTTVKVLFPALDAAAKRAVPPTASDRRVHHTVLVADDNAMVRKLARRSLERSGYQVLLAEDGQDAIDRYHAADGQVDVVVVDVTMPRLNGTEVFRTLRALDPDLPVILTSGFMEEDVTAGLASRGLVGFLQKPFTPDQLRQALAEALADRSSGQDGQ